MARKILKEIQDQPPIDHRDILLENVNCQVFQLYINKIIGHRITNETV